MSFLLLASRETTSLVFSCWEAIYRLVGYRAVDLLKNVETFRNEQVATLQDDEEHEADLFPETASLCNGHAEELSRMCAIFNELS